MLPTRRSQAHSRQAQLQHTASSRPLHALRSTLANRRANSSVQCASAKKPEELSPQVQLHAVVVTHCARIQYQ